MTQSPTPTDMTPEDEAIVDAALSAATVPDARAALKRDILAAYDDEQRKARRADNGFSGFAGFGGLFAHFRAAAAGALASVSALGLAAGALTANTTATLSPEDELYIYAEDAFNLALLEDEEWDQWVAE